MKDRVGLDRYEKGGFYRVDDRSGARVRAYDTREEWQGAIVDKGDWEARNAQEFLRSVRDDQSVPKSRPVPPPIFVGPLETAIATKAIAGAMTINVDSSVGCKVGDRLGIVMDDFNLFFTTIKDIPNGSNINIATPLPLSTSIGNMVVDYQPVPPPNL